METHCQRKYALEKKYVRQYPPERPKKSKKGPSELNAAVTKDLLGRIKFFEAAQRDKRWRHK